LYGQKKKNTISQNILICYTEESHGLEQNWGVNGIQIMHLWAHYWSNCRQGVYHLNL